MQRLLQRLPALPWRLCVAALVARLLLGGDLPGWVPAALTPWLTSLDELLLSYAALLVAAWFFVDVPAAFNLWRQPPKILRDLVLLLISTTLTVVIVQQQVRINLVSLVTASAVLTAVIGLAAQETLKDLFAGMTLQLDPPFRLGDWIAIGEARGVVTSLTLMNTELTIFDGSTVVLPNSFVAEEQLRRIRADQPLGVHFKIGLDYGFPPAQARRLLRDVLARHRLVLDVPVASVWIDAYGDSAIVYEILAYAQGTSQFAIRDLRSEILIDIWYALRREGQSIPFPVRQLHAPSQGRRSSTELINSWIQERDLALRRNPLFAGLSDAQRQQLAVMTRIQDFAPGEAVVIEGDDDDDFFQVLSGHLEVSRSNPASGHEQVITTLATGDIFGEMSLLLDAPRSATVRALEDVRLLRVRRDDIASLLEQDPQLLEQLAEIVNERRRALEALAEQPLVDSRNDIIASMRSLFGALLRRS